ncbi:MAG: hypothetical protein ABIQ39_07675 [Ilumatobacteraceae bacterium]
MTSPSPADETLAVNPSSGGDAAGVRYDTPICGHRACAWCATEFAVLYRAGRPRLYCNHSCRQRAYEHRHGFHHDRTTRRLPGQTRHESRLPHLGSGYERGGHAFSPTTKIHALRTSVRPELGRRETLCGALSTPLTTPLSNQSFFPGHPNACRSCGQIATNNPLEHPIQPSNELARLRAIIDEVGEHRNDLRAALTWLHSDNPEPARSRTAA